MLGLLDAIHKTLGKFLTKKGGQRSEKDLDLGVNAQREYLKERNVCEMRQEWYSHLDATASAPHGDTSRKSWLPSGTVTTGNAQ
jgi:hypothetical protein